MKENNIYSFDTNVLVYSIDSQDKYKHEIAKNIIYERLVAKDCVLTTQVLGEFFCVVVRQKLVKPADALKQIELFQTLFPVIVAKQQTINKAISGVIKHKLSFWDAMLWATVKEAKVDILITEDFQHNQVVDEVKFFNPFMD